MKKTIAKHDKPIASFEFANAISQSKKGFGLHSLMLCKLLIRERGFSAAFVIFLVYVFFEHLSSSLFGIWKRIEIYRDLKIN